MSFLATGRSLVSILCNPKRLRRGVQLLRSHEWFEEHAWLTLWGSISRHDEEQLAIAVLEAEKLPGPIIEIGCLFGFTTQLIATLKSREKPLISIENFSWNPFGMSASNHRDFTHRTLRYCMKHCNVSLFDGSNRDFYRSYEGPTPSMVFIDADHSYQGVKEDIDWALRLQVPIISGHDYMSLHPGIVRAVDETFHGNVAIGGSVWIAKNSSVTQKKEA